MKSSVAYWEICNNSTKNHTQQRNLENYLLNLPKLCFQTSKVELWSFKSKMGY